MLEGNKILVTGATGEVARAICASLAGANEVWGAARFSDADARTALERQGVKTFAWSLGSDDFAGLPGDFDYVVHAAASIFAVRDDYDEAIRQNAEGAGLLMHHVRKAKALLFVSTQHVYTELADTSIPRKESDPLGCHPSYAPAYSTSKVSAEAVVRTLCRIYQLPTTIGRLGTNYGVGCSGVPDFALKKMLAGETLVVPPRGKAYCPLVHNGTIAAQVEPLLKAASVPATIVNWTGDANVDIREVYDFMAEIAGLDPRYEESPTATPLGGASDPTKRISITGPEPRHWKDNVAEMVRENYPELKLRV